MPTRENIIANIGQLSVTPRVIRHLSHLLKSPDDDMSAAIGALKAEPVLSAAILAACNAPSHYRGGHLLDVEAAVHRLGYRETYRIALLITFRQGLRIPNLPDNRAADYLWRRAATAACAMEELTLLPDERPAAYTIGLLHLIGCFILARNGMAAMPTEGNDWGALAEEQSRHCGLGYPEAGALALEQWGFPPEVTDPIRHQLTPLQAGDHAGSARQLWRSASLASFIEACRPGSPGYRSDDAALAQVDSLTQRIEERSLDLIETFYTVPIRRPAWAEAR